MTKAVIFQHMASNGPGTLQTAMERWGISCQIVHTAYEDVSGFDALAPDILLVLGGAPGVYQADDFTFLRHEQRILEKRLAADKPTLGICLGAQLMAAALGAKVYKGKAGSEIGWFDMRLTEEGQASSVRAFAGAKVMQWHGDTFDLPEGAILLGSSENYQNHIFSHGKNAVAFQGHIEVTAPILADWYVQDAGIFVKHPELLKKLRDDTRHNVDAMTNATESFMQEWLDRVLSQPE